MESSRHQNALADTTQIYEKKIAELVKQLQDEHARFEVAEEQLDLAKRLLTDHQKTMQVILSLLQIRSYWVLYPEF